VTQLRGPGFDAPSVSDDRIVLAMGQGRDRDLLVNWLDAFPRYAVTVAGRPTDVPDEYDLCLVSRDCLREFRSTLRARTDTDRSAYLPHVVTVHDDEDDDIDLDDTFVTDVVTIPIEKTALRRRLENLLQARRSSVRLAERQQQYERLVQLTPEAILLVDDGDIVYANEAAATLFDVSDPAAVEGRALASFVDDDETGRLETVLDDISADDRDREEFAELRVRTATGEPRDVALAGVTVRYGGRQMEQLVIRDLTEQKEREQQLTLFGRAIDSAAQGITIADAEQADTPLIYANEGFEQITGYSVQNVLGRNCRFLQGENTEQARVEELREAIEAERPVAVDLLNYRQDGTPFWNRLEIVPVEDDEGNVTHYLGLQRDVTEQKEREQQLAVLNRVLRHNLRNKMNVIQVYADQLATGDLQEEAVAAIKTAADDLMTISEQIRKFDSIIAADERDLHTLDLVDVLEESLTGLTGRAPEMEVDLTAPETAPILAHETLKPALTDLVSLTDAVEAPNLAVDVATGSEEVVMTVTDRGNSLNPDDLEIVASDAETPLEHLQSLELWLIRWAVEESHGEFIVDVEGECPTVTLRFLRPDSRAAG
jgi:PAS domain S-box-containing protein